jgi:hypothetical protein
MKSINLIGFLGLIFFSGFATAECANPKRTIYAFAYPASMTTIILSNPSNVTQNVMVKITSSGGEQIYNTWVDQKFGICVWNGSGCDWKIPNGSSLSCNALSFNLCAGNFALAAGGMKKLAFGSLLTMSGCSNGCNPANLDAPDAGSMIEISVCEKEGFLIGGIVSFFDLVDNNISREVNGGRPF